MRSPRRGRNQHQHPFGLLDDSAVSVISATRAVMISSRGPIVGWRDVHVVAVHTDHRTVVAGEAITHHHDLSDLISGVDDAVPGAERTAALQHRVDGSRDLTSIFGMLVRQHQFGGRRHRARLVAVHALHLVRPLPAVVAEIEPEPADALRRARERFTHLDAVVGLGRRHGRPPTVPLNLRDDAYAMARTSAAAVHSKSAPVALVLSASTGRGHFGSGDVSGGRSRRQAIRPRPRGDPLGAPSAMSLLSHAPSSRSRRTGRRTPRRTRRRVTFLSPGKRYSYPLRDG